MDQSKTIYIGSDQEGHMLKNALKEFFQTKGLKFLDIGLFNNDTADFSTIKAELNEKVKEENAVGILLFGKQQLTIEEEKNDDKKKLT